MDTTTTAYTPSTAQDFDRAASSQTKDAGGDTATVVSKTRSLTQMIRDEVAERPYQALAVAALAGLFVGMRR